MILIQRMKLSDEEQESMLSFLDGDKDTFKMGMEMIIGYVSRSQDLDFLYKLDEKLANDKHIQAGIAYNYPSLLELYKLKYKIK